MLFTPWLRSLKFPSRQTRTAPGSRRKTPEILLFSMKGVSMMSGLTLWRRAKAWLAQGWSQNALGSGLHRPRGVEALEPRLMLSFTPGVPFASSQLLLSFADEASSDDIAAFYAEQLLIEDDDFENTQDLRLLSVNDDVTEALIAQLEQHPLVQHAEPDYLLHPTLTPNDLHPTLWGLHNTGQTGGTPDADIDAPEAWDTTTGSASIVIAVMDTGVDISHPDLAANIWTNPGEIPGNGVDDDGNGFTDDVNGWDFFNNDNSVFDSASNDAHGTLVSGTIAAEGNNGGITGVNWKAQIMPLKFLGPSGGYISGAITAIQYATDMGADLINASWGGGGYSKALKNAIEAFPGVFVAAAGNDGANTDASPHYPSNYDSANLISVAATDHNDQLASFSNFGATSVDLGAPGKLILSTMPGGRYGRGSGTSMAAPHVSGVAGLVLAQNPGLTAVQVKDQILAAVDPLTALDGITVTGGRLNAANTIGPPSPGITVSPMSGLVTTEAGGSDSFSIVLNTQPTADVTIGISSNDTSEGTVSPTSLTFTSTNWNVAKTVTVTGVDDTAVDGNVAFSIMTATAVSADTDYNGLDPADVAVTNLDNEVPPTPQTKFFVVDKDLDDTFEYDPSGGLITNTNLASGNVDPTGATANAAGTRLWVVDKNKTVYVYNGDGNPQGSWSAGGLNRAGGVATHETDIWIVDKKNKEVYRYANAAGKTSGSQNFTSSFPLDGANQKAKGITTDGVSIWIVDDGKNGDRVFKYDISGALKGDWAIDGSNAKPSGIALDGGDLWIVDSGNGSVFQYVAAAGLTSGSQAAASSFPLDANNSRAEGIATVDGGPVNQPPEAVNDVYDVNEDNTLNIAAAGVLANDTDAEGDSLTAVLVAGPSDGSLTLNSDGSFTYTPSADFNGADSFTYRANDGTGNSNLATVTINVNPINDAPVAVDDGYIGDQDTTLNVTLPGVLGNDVDVDGDPLSALPVTGPTSGLLTVNPDGSFDYTPNSGFFGTDTFTYKANDGYLDSNVATVTITVNRVNNAPVAVDDSYATDEDTGLSISVPGVLGNDADADLDPLSAVLLSGPTDGTLALNADGSFTYTPDANFNGTDSLTYKANDGIADSNAATVSITVNPVNDAPLAVDDSASTDQDLAVTIGVLANDSDVDGDTLGVDSVTQGASGSVVVNLDGTVTYTPNAGFTGGDSFTYTVGDGNGGSAAATVSVAVVAASSTKFFVVDSDVGNTFEYDDAGGALPDDTWNLAAGNVDPKGATTNTAGDKVWVVDKNRDVYVYDGDGASLGSWTAGGLNRPDGIATDETDIWVLDSKNKRVYRYSNAAGTTSGSQNAASSFALDGANRKAKGITTDGASIWIVDDGKNGDKVFKYNTSGTLLSSWSIDGANAKPSGITIDPSGSSQSIWIVDRGNAMVFEYASARGNPGGSLSGSFGLASGNTRPEGIADPFVKAAAAATDQVLSQGTADPLTPLYWADFATSHDSHSRPKKNEATDLALIMMME